MKDKEGRTEQSADAGKTRNSPSTSAWDLRRADIEWNRSLQEAAFEYQRRLASALADYNNEMKAVWRSVRDEELSSLNQATTSAASSDATAEHRVAAALDWTNKVRAIGRTGNDRAATIARTLAEEQQKAWLDNVETRRKGYEKYVDAIGKSYPGGGGAGLGVLASPTEMAMNMFALRGDEGLA